MKLERFDYVQLADVFATNPATGAHTPYLQGFQVTEPVDSEVIPRRALHPFITPIEGPILMSRVVMVNCQPVPRCAFCGFLLKASDTFCCPECGWKV